MRINKINKSAFTLLEILLSAIIFVISVAGIFATLNAVRQPVVQKQRSLTAAILGQQLLESLRTQVDASQLTSGTWPLALGLHNTAATFPPGIPVSQIIQGVTYTFSYTVTCADGSANGCNTADTPRKVSLTVTFLPDAT
ncbi:MAG: type II secretion system protein [Candidatus Omnitrophica bacterium]|nr:type II secretion system protein [Candidatus Omnitrophota bacterium]